MRFPERLFLHLKDLWHNTIAFIFKKDVPKTIPDTINENEILIRGIFHPIHFKKGKITEMAFLPKSGDNDVSILRRNYTTDDFCKSFFATMPSKMNYRGLFAFLAQHIAEISEKCGIKDKVSLKVTPLDENKKEVKTRPILETFPGLPMHADLHYYDRFEKGEVQTNYREFARKLITHVDKYFEDPNIPSPHWEGPDLGRIF